jgi:uroporphyrinogen III methyltransferase/synthase
MSKVTPGTVYFVGAGPGDPGLLTRRAAELLARAACVVHDGLVPPAILRLARPGAEVVDVRWSAGEGGRAPESLDRLLAEKARTGHEVVRLEGGDPFVFGRTDRVAAALAAAGIPFEVVPGVSSFGAAAHGAGIPLTHRACASAFFVVAATRPQGGTPAADADWNLIARQRGTKIVRLETDSLATITAALQAGGLDPSTPAALICRGATPGQEVVEGTLDTLAARATAAGLRFPAIAVFGEVVRQRPVLDWFEHRPLFGRRIVVPRSRETGAGRLISQLAELGAHVLDLPTTRRETPTERGPMIESLAGLGEYEWILFPDPHGVEAFFDALLAAYEDLRALGNARLAAVGPETARRLAELRLRTEATPGSADGPEIARAIGACEGLENLRILLVRGADPAPDLTRELEDAGAVVDDVSFYRLAAIPTSEDPHGDLADLHAHGADWFVFPSSAAVRHLHQRTGLPGLLRRHPRGRLASIGPETTRALAALDLRPDVEAPTPTLDALVRALTDAR